MILELILDFVSVFMRRLLLFVLLTFLQSLALEFWFIDNFIGIQYHGAVPSSGMPTVDNLFAIFKVGLFIGFLSTTAIFLAVSELRNSRTGENYES